MPDNTYFHLTVLSGILSDPLISAFAAYRNGKTPALKTAFLHELFERKAEKNFSAYVAEAVMKDDNAFSRACAAGDDLSDFLKSAYIADLEEIGRALDFESAEFETGKAPVPVKSWDEKAANLLYGYYQSSGYGKFISCNEFRYDEERGLVPVGRPLSSAVVKGYEKEYAEVYDNLENFVKGLPCANLLLVGAHGLGKTALLRAAANSFHSQKLRLVTLSMENLKYLDRLSEILSEIPLRFVVLVEGFEAGARVPEYAGGNVLVAATAREKRSGFWFVVSFPEADLSAFLSIVRELAKDYKLKLSPDELETAARLWAKKHGFSPFSAKQLAGYLFSCQKKGKDINI